MSKYTLISRGYPRLRQGQEEVVYKCLEPYSTQHFMSELIKAAKDRKLPSLFRSADSTTIEESLNFHLGAFIEKNIVRVVDDPA